MAPIHSSLFLFLSIGSVSLAVPLPSGQGREGTNNPRRLQQTLPRPQPPLQPIPNFQRVDWLDLSLGTSSHHQREVGLEYMQLELPGQHSGDAAISSAGASSSSHNSGRENPNVDPKTFQRPRSPPSPRSIPPTLPNPSQQLPRVQRRRQPQGGLSLDIPENFEGGSSRRVLKAWQRSLPSPERDATLLTTRLSEAMEDDAQRRRGITDLAQRRKGASMLSGDDITTHDGTMMWQAKDDPRRLREIYKGILERRRVNERARQAAQP